MQSPLFFEDVNDALRAVVAALGGMKEVGCRMRPEKGPEHAARWLADCLNPDRSEKLGPEQVLWLLSAAREAGFHDPMRWLAGAAGYQPPLPMDPTAELTDLTRQMAAQMSSLERLVGRMEHLREITQPGASVRAVK